MPNTLPNISKLTERLKQATRKQVKVGIEAGATYPNGTAVSEVAAFLEYGWVQKVTGKQAGWFRGQGVHVKPGATLFCPPRPFFSATVLAKSERWKKIGSKLAQGITQNPEAVAQRALIGMGQTAQQDIQDAVLDGAVEGTSFAPRADLTMLLYEQQLDGHRTDGTPNNMETRQPLKKTGILAGAIAFDIEDGS